MAPIGWLRGHEAYYDGNDWRYLDTHEIADDSRPCIPCGKFPTLEGYDACTGYIPGAISACCGHGLGPLSVMMEDNTKLKSLEGGDDDKRSI